MMEARPMVPRVSPSENSAPIRWLLRAAALLAPLSEVGLELPLLLAFLVGLPAHIARLRRPPSGPLGARGPELLVAVGFVGWLWCGLAACALSGLTPRFSHLTKLLLGFAVLVGAVELARTREAELRRLFLLLLAGTVLALGAGLLQYFTGTFPGEAVLLGDRPGWRGQLYLSGSSARALTGTLLNRLKMAEVLLFTAAALAAAAFSSRRLRVRGLLVGAWIAVTGALMLTSVKAALGGLVAGVLVATGLTAVPAVRRWVPRASLLALLLMGTLVLVGADAASPSVQAPDGSFEVRTWVWQHALVLFGERPWLGTGLGTYQAAAAPVFGFASGVWRSSAHNHHLTVLVEGGIVGFAFWLSLCAGLVLALRRSWAMPGVDRAGGALRHLATSYLVGIACLSVMHDVLWHPGTAVLTWLCGGLLLASATGDESWHEPEALGGPRPGSRGAAG